MPFDISGVFSRLYSWVNDRDTGVKINAPRMDAETDGIAAAINAIVSQTQPFTAPLRVVAGTAAAVAVASNGVPNTGFYFPASAKIAAAILGANVFELNAAKWDISVPIHGSALRGLVGVAQTVGGTPNAITVDMPTGGLAGGLTFMFRPASTNSGATTLNLSGTGVKGCITVTGAALPAGYLVAGEPTLVRYNGTSFVIERSVEYGSNANGEYWRYADGRQICSVAGGGQDTTTASGSLFMTTAVTTWTFPATFIASPVMSGSIVFNTTRWLIFNSTNGISGTYRQMNTASSATSLASVLRAEGVWY